MLHNLLIDGVGTVLSSELVLILTIAVLALVVGLSEVAVAVNTELNDLSNAFGHVNQSFGYTGFHTYGGSRLKSFVYGASWFDDPGICSNNTDSQLIGGIPPVQQEGVR